MRARAVCILPEAAAFPAAKKPLFARSFFEGIEQHHLQITAMNLKLRPFVACVAAGGLAMDELTEAVVKRRLLGGDRNLCERIFQAQLAERLNCMGQQGDSYAHCLYFRRRLINATGDARLVQGERQGQPTDSAADNHRFHTLNLLVA